MKKTLMVLGLAMFATAASAQINGEVLVGNDQGLRKSFTQRVEQPTVDYYMITKDLTISQ